MFGTRRLGGSQVSEASKNFCESLGIEHPIICGAMYPCSNVELVAAASEAGGIGVVQPLTLTYVNGLDFREGLRQIKALTSKPIGMNALIEGSSKIYMDRMAKYVDIALDEGVRFFVTALGNPSWVVEKVHERGGTVFHDVTDLNWAEKALKANVDGFICVNNRAGGHAGHLTKEMLFERLTKLGKPLICAGGLSTKDDIQKALDVGFAGVQLGTRFIATQECNADLAYKNAIVAAKEGDVVLSEKITGVPVSVINTPSVQKLGLKANPLEKLLLQHRKTKHWMRMFYSLKSFHSLKKSINAPSPYKDIWQAGKSVEGIDSIKSVKEVFDELT